MPSPDFIQRYRNAAHAMQTGVAMWMEQDSSETSPKHLRVGVNSALRSNGVLVALLIKKGVITEEEWAEALAEGMEAEADSYRKMLEERFGIKVTLG